MVWRRLWAGVVGGGDRAEAFLRRLLDAQQEVAPAEAGATPVVTTLGHRVWLAERRGEVPADELRCFEELRGQLLDRYPDGDALALRWLCDVAGLRRSCDEHLPATSPAYAPGPYLELVDTLHL
jgi:hypothetical protein